MDHNVGTFVIVVYVSCILHNNKALRRVWKLPYCSHRHIVYYLSDNASFQCQIESRSVKMFQTIYKSDNMLISFLSRRALLDMSGCLGSKCGYLMFKYKCSQKDCVRDGVCFILNLELHM